MSGPTRRTSAEPETPAPRDPREHAVSAALERARAARAELKELRRTREEAIRRADAAIRALDTDERPPSKSGDRVQEALDTIDRVTRIPTPGDKR
jgi:hypothetical protein